MVAATTPKLANTAQARLVLQDPQVLGQAQTPSSRLSTELAPAPETGMDRATAQQTWEALQLQTEDVVSLRAQVKQQSLQILASGKAAKDARAEATGLRVQLAINEEQRFKHPLVYGLGAAALGVGLLWLFERKKRAVVQNQVSQLHRRGTPVPLPSSMPLNEVQPRDTAKLEKQDISFLLPDPWWRRVWPRRKPIPVMPTSELSLLPPTQNSVRSDQTALDSVLSEMPSQITETEFFDPEFAQIDLFSQTRLKPNSPDDGMGHLLELRMAVQALCALEQPVMAQRLLAQHIEAVPLTSGWAYLEYLDLCSQLDQRDAFEAMRLCYRTQFNRLAPYWMEPNSNVQGLESYERPLAELSGVWPSERAKTLLQNWLLGNPHARRLFQLPAYHDLLDLYELLEHLDEKMVAAQEEVDSPITVSLLELDYEFSEDVKLLAQSEEEPILIVPTVKTGNFAVDVNLGQAASQPAGLFPTPLTPFSPKPKSDSPGLSG